MRIALVGYGKMGKEIEHIAIERGHQISFRIALENRHEIQLIEAANTDVAIEFSQPESAFDNLKVLLSKSIPTVCGTTGWLDKQKDIENLAIQNQTAFFYASNFSLGVNLFFKLNEILAKMMNSTLNIVLRWRKFIIPKKKMLPVAQPLHLQMVFWKIIHTKPLG